MNTRSIARAARAVLFISTVTGLSATAAAQRVVIDFNDPAGLLAIPGDCSRSGVCKGALFTFANFYREDGMLFTDGVNPPDPALGAARANHYHLSYEDRSIEFGFVQDKFTVGRRTPAGFVPLTNPENENRTLSPHEPGSVIQLIYDPNNDGVPDPFNLISLVVHAGKLNVGVKSPATGISVYNNLTAGFEWFLINANNLTRATLEVPVAFGSEGIFTVDRIVFEPAASAARGSARVKPAQTPGEVTPVPLESVTRVALDPALFEVVDLAAPTFGTLEISDARVERTGPAQDRLEMTGILHPGRGSDGVVDVPNESVIVTFGSFRETVPAGLFTCVADQEKTQCDFTGPAGGITAMRITLPPAAAPGPASFNVRAEGLDLSTITADPLPLAVQAGNDLGVTTRQVSGTTP